MVKIYKCCICNKVLEEKPIRLTKQEYGVGRYKQYTPVANYDICKRCIIIFERWIKKHNGEDTKSVK